MRAAACRHCGELIICFTFTEGEQWWHVDQATRLSVLRARGVPAPTRRGCDVGAYEPVAEPL
jgi:hypothetical protein